MEVYKTWQGQIDLKHFYIVFATFFTLHSVSLLLHLGLVISDKFLTVRMYTLQQCFLYHYILLLNAYFFFPPEIYRTRNLFFILSVKSSVIILKLQIYAHRRFGDYETAAISCCCTSYHSTSILPDNTFLP